MTDTLRRYKMLVENGFDCSAEPLLAAEAGTLFRALSPAERAEAQSHREAAEAGRDECMSDGRD